MSADVDRERIRERVIERKVRSGVVAKSEGKALARLGNEPLIVMPPGPRIDLGPVRQPGGKVVTAFAVPGDLNPADAHSNSFELEWPKGSGQVRTFPEVDRVEWFPVGKARVKLLKGQLALLDQLMADPGLAGLGEG